MFALSLACCALIAGCKPKPAAPGTTKEPPKPIEVSLVPVQRRSIDRTVEVTGSLFGEEELTIAAKVPGRIASLAADLGDEVKPGASVAQVEPADYELVVAQEESSLRASLAKLGLAEIPASDVDLSTLPVISRAKAQEANAKARLDRARQLFQREPPLISAQEFADISTQWEVASTSAEVELLNARTTLAEVGVRQAALAVARKGLSETTVVAPAALPVSFHVSARHVSVGEMVSQNQPLFRLVAADRVKFRGRVPERFSSEVRVGQAGRLRVDAFPEPFAATVTRVSPAVDPASRTFEIEILAENPARKLRPGAFARAHIVVGNTPDAVFVPETALAQFAGVQRVFTVKDGKAVEHRVRTGQVLNGLVEVSDGTNLGDRVIDKPLAVAAGAPVIERGAPAPANPGARSDGRTP